MILNLKSFTTPLFLCFFELFVMCLKLYVGLISVKHRDIIDVSDKLQKAYLLNASKYQMLLHHWK